MRSLKVAFTPESEVVVRNEADEAATELGLPVTARIAADGGEVATVETRLGGRGAYLVGPEGLTHSGPHAHGLPIAALCWLDETSHLRCQPGEAAGLPTFMMEITVVGANGRTPEGRASYLREQDQILWETNGTDGYGFAQLEGVDTLLDLGPIDSAMYPLQLDIAAQPDNRNPGIDVAGFDDDDIFFNQPVTAGFLVEDPTDLRPELPALARFPFDVWKVTIEQAGQPLFVQLAPDYAVNLSGPWNGLEAGAALPLAAWDSHFRQDQTSITFLLPVTADATEVSMQSSVTGRFDDTAKRFTVDGPGLYLATPDGVVPATDRP